MSKPPEEPKKLRTWPAVFAALEEAATELDAQWYRDTKGRLRVLTPDGKVCCPVTLIALNRTGIFVPVERVKILFSPGNPHGRPINNDLAVDLILTADNRTTEERIPNPEIRANLERICQIKPRLQEARTGSCI